MSTITLLPKGPGWLEDRDGTRRIGGTRVTLDTILEAVEGGHSAADIARMFPAVRIEDIRSALQYCREHPVEIREYLEAGMKQAEALRRELDCPADRLRERLLKRRPDDMS